MTMAITHEQYKGHDHDYDQYHDFDHDHRKYHYYGHIALTKIDDFDHDYGYDANYKYNDELGSVARLQWQSQNHGSRQCQDRFLLPLQLFYFQSV